MKKLAIIINGQGGVGKDTLCDVAKERYVTRNKSSVDPIKDIAKMAMWDPKNKDDRARKFLSDLKRLTVDYNDFPTVWGLEQYKQFLSSKEEEVFFFHVREPEEIAKFVQATEGKAVTLLVRAQNRMKNHGAYGNVSDDSVENYTYDYIFDNDAPKEIAAGSFLSLLEKMFTESAIETE